MVRVGLRLHKALNEVGAVLVKPVGRLIPHLVLAEASVSQHLFELLPVIVEVVAGANWRVRLGAPQHREYLFLYCPLDAVFLAAPDRETCASTRLEHSSGLFYLGALVWYNHKAQIGNIAVEEGAGEWKALNVGATGVDVALLGWPPLFFFPLK